MRGAGVAVGVLSGLLASACFQAPSTTPVSGESEGCGDSCSRRGSGGGSGGASSGSGSGGTSGSGGSGSSSSSAVVTTASGTSSSSSSGSSSGGSSSGACSGVIVTSQVTDADSLISGAVQPIVGADVSAIGVDGVPIGGESAATDSTGTFSLCVVPGQEFSTQITSTGYVTSNLENLAPSQNATVQVIPLAASDTVVAYSVVLQGFISTDALIIAEVIPSGAQAPCNDPAGWTISATLLDGGAISYLTAYGNDAGTIHPSLTATQSLTQDGQTFGLGFIYNLDPSLTDAVIVSATQVGSTNGCSVNDGGPFTGRIVVGASEFSFAPLMLQ